MNAQSFSVGPVRVTYRPTTQTWTVIRGTWLRLAYSEAEARRYAAAMAMEVF